MNVEGSTTPFFEMFHCSRTNPARYRTPLIPPSMSAEGSSSEAGKRLMEPEKARLSAQHMT